MHITAVLCSIPGSRGYWMGPDNEQFSYQYERDLQKINSLAAAIEDEQLMPDQHRFGNYTTGASRHCQSEHGDDQMNK
jgi:hypothetical protein